MLTPIEVHFIIPIRILEWFSNWWYMARLLLYCKHLFDFWTLWTGAVQKSPARIHFILPLLQIFEIWWETKLLIPEKAFPWSLYPRRWGHELHSWVRHLPRLVSSLTFGVVASCRLSVWLCVWLDHIEVPTDWSGHSNPGTFSLMVVNRRSFSRSPCSSLGHISFPVISYSSRAAGQVELSGRLQREEREHQWGRRFATGSLAPSRPLLEGTAQALAIMAIITPSTKFRKKRRHHPRTLSVPSICPLHLIFFLLPIFPSHIKIPDALW